MADFCHDCSIELFGKDFRDFADLGAPQKGGWLVICEGCGLVVVDEHGYCDCLKHRSERRVKE